MRQRLRKIELRRKSEGKTNYNLRLNLLKSGKPRLVVRRLARTIVVQIAEYSEKGDKIIAAANSIFLRKLGWKKQCNNTPAAYLTGYLAGMKALKKVKEAVLDIGIQKSVKGSVIYAAVKGAADAGLKIPYDQEIIPSKERIEGKHLNITNFNEFVEKIKSSK